MALEASLYLVLSCLVQDPQSAAKPVPITVLLQPGDLAAGRLNWSPKGAKIALVADHGALAGSFRLGPNEAPPIAVRLTKSEGSEHYDRFWIDVDRNGKPGDDEVLTAKVSEQRGKWWSSADATLTIPVTGDGGGAKSRPYPVSLWFVEDPQEPTAEPQLRWSRRGFHEGQCTIDGKPAFVLVTEMEMDGVFDQRDAWALSRDRAALRSAPARSMESHVWLDGVAWRMTALDADGNSITFERFDPGCTEAEERERNDTEAVDRRSPRAAAPLPFGTDLAAALADGKQHGKRVFVDFQTTWCGPCHAMEQHVYTADAVVKAAAGTIAVKLDGDVQRELTKQYEVKAYPTMLLLDADGKVLRRLVGYQHVTDMVTFFGAN